MKETKYIQAYDGDWFTVKDIKDFKFQCCDCALVHQIQFEIGEDGKLHLCLNVDKEETEKARKMETKINVA